MASETRRGSSGDRATGAGAPAMLATLQRRMLQLISSPGPLEDAVQRLAAHDPGIAQLERWIDAPSRSVARRQLSIYAEMFAARLRAVLAADYPALEAAIGPELFFCLASDYIASHPSRRGSVRHFGRRMPEFVAQHALSDRWPFLADLVRLELARGDMIDAADARPLRPADLAALPGQSWPDLVLSRVHASHLLQLDYPVHRLWLAINEDEPQRCDVRDPAPTYLVTWRHELTVYHRALERREFETLVALDGQTAFAGICERIAEGSNARDAALYLVERLRLWAEDGLLMFGGPSSARANPGAAKRAP